NFTAKGLFNTCNQYGYVVDSFIPLKRSKVGKRFGFVRFINVFSVERLVSNLCTIWIDRLKLHANVTRFHRPSGKPYSFAQKAGGTDKNAINNMKFNANMSKKLEPIDKGVSFANVVKCPDNYGSKVNDSPALILEDDCVLSKDLSNCLFGRVKEFTSLANIKLSLNNKGFLNLKISYMGERWIMVEFDDPKAKNLFRENASVNSWFSQITQASTDFVLEGRMAWVEIEGVPFKLWSKNTFKHIATKWGVMLDIEDQEDDCFHSKRICVQTNSNRWISDEFKIIYRGKVFWIRAKKAPGWVLDFTNDDDDKVNSEVDLKEDNFKMNEQNSDVFSDVEGVPETLFEEDETRKKSDEVDSTGKQENKSKDPFNLYPLLKKKGIDPINQEPDYSLKYPPGFTPKADTYGTSIHDEAANDVNIPSRSEANVNMGDNLKGGSESKCSGHFKQSNGPRSSGGSILDLLDDVVKEQNGMYLIIVVYAPHDAKEKVMLWDYLAREITRWKGKVVVMGDFNEVRFRSDRFGSNFNIHRANIFNSFISTAGLTDVELGGCSFTWIWNKANLANRNQVKDQLNSELETVENLIDSGFGNDEVVSKRMDIVKNLQHINNLKSMEMAQKAKVKWAVEGDENSSFFHVKHEFLMHFSNRSAKPDHSRAILQIDFPKTLTLIQQFELESEVSKEEIKRAVWDCGTDKAPGPDGFTFGFYRNFWSIIENDVYKASPGLQIRTKLLTYGTSPTSEGPKGGPRPASIRIRMILTPIYVTRSATSRDRGGHNSFAVRPDSRDLTKQRRNTAWGTKERTSTPQKRITDEKLIPKMSNSAERTQMPANSVVRNTAGKGSKQATDGNPGFLPEDRLREICEKHYNKILPIIAEKVHQEKLKGVSGSESCDKKRKTKKRRSPSPDTMSRSTRLGRSPSVFSRLRQEESSSTRQRSPVSTTVFTRLGARDRNVFTSLGEKKRDIHSQLGPKVASRQKDASGKRRVSSVTSAEGLNRRRKEARNLGRNYVTCSSERQREIEEEWDAAERANRIRPTRTKNIYFSESEHDDGRH
nr:nucleotide-binding alpha-beta plait domain-containing protein [Tanacetum cinerariifolium]